jgi:hypothetical protein
MAEIKVIASPNFEEHKASLVTLLGSAVLGIRRKGEWGSEQIDLKQHLESIAVQTEDDIRKLSGAAGWGLAGTLALGPLGLVLGALWLGAWSTMGSRKKVPGTCRGTWGDRALAMALPGVNPGNLNGLQASERFRGTFKTHLRYGELRCSSESPSGGR